MRFVPQQRVLLRSALSPEQLAERLARMVERPPRVRWPWSGTTKPFQGYVEARFFKIWRSSVIHDVFGPIVCGVIRPVDGGAAVSVVMRLDHLVTAVLAVGVVKCALTAAGRQLDGFPSAGSEERVVAAVFPFIACALCTAVFRFGVRNALRQLAVLAAPGEEGTEQGGRDVLSACAGPR